MTSSLLLYQPIQRALHRMLRDLRCNALGLVLPQNQAWWATPTIRFSAFDFLSPVRRRVAQAGQGMSARTDETTSHSTKLANDASQVAGYV